MWHPQALLASATVWLLLLGFGVEGPTYANPKNYPEFAQRQVDPAMPIHFITANQVKKRLDDGMPQMVVDVRSPNEYAQGHLPRAVSIPLGVLSVRLTEIPRDIPVVLY